MAWCNERGIWPSCQKCGRTLARVRQAGDLPMAMTEDGPVCARCMRGDRRGPKYAVDEATMPTGEDDDMARRDWMEEYNGVPLWQHCFMLRAEGHGPKRTAELLNEDYDLGLKGSDVSRTLHNYADAWEVLDDEEHPEETPEEAPDEEQATPTGRPAVTINIKPSEEFEEALADGSIEQIVRATVGADPEEKPAASADAPPAEKLTDGPVTFATADGIEVRIDASRRLPQGLVWRKCCTGAVVEATDRTGHLYDPHPQTAREVHRHRSFLGFRIDLTDAQFAARVRQATAEVIEVIRGTRRRREADARLAREVAATFGAEGTR